MASAAVLGWCPRPVEELLTWQALAGRVAAAGRQARHHAAVSVFAWALDGACAPVAGRPGPPDLAAARAEHTAALVLAELGREPTEQEWRALGNADPPAAARTSTEWGYGAWRVLDWLLHPAVDPPVQLWEGRGPRKPWPVLPPAARTAVRRAFAATGLAVDDLDPRAAPRPTTRPSTPA